MYCVSPAELLTPVSTVECLTKELQHSLDLQSALEGSRIINAEVSVISTGIFSETVFCFVKNYEFFIVLPSVKQLIMGKRWHPR